MLCPACNQADFLEDFSLERAVGKKLFRCGSSEFCSHGAGYCKLASCQTREMWRTFGWRQTLARIVPIVFVRIFFPNATGL